MRCNVGGVDRIGRLILGAVLLVLGFFAPLGASGQIVVLLLAVIALATAILRYCPLNTLFGIDSCGGDRPQR